MSVKSVSHSSGICTAVITVINARAFRCRDFIASSPITPQIMNSNHTFICNSHHNKQHGTIARARPCGWEQHWRTPWTLTPAPYCAGVVWWKCVTRAFLVSHQPDSSQTHALLSHWKSPQVSTRAADSMFAAPPAGAQRSSLCWDAARPFFTACFIFYLTHTR